MWLLEFNIETHLWQAGTKARLDGGGENKMTFFIFRFWLKFNMFFSFTEKNIRRGEEQFFHLY